MRPITIVDLPALKEIIDSNDLFPSVLLDEMTESFLNGVSQSEIWLTIQINEIPVGILYCAPERMTEGTYNLYLIAVHKDHHGKGIGSEMMAFIEQKLKKSEARVLIVETSSLPEFGRTRSFYGRLGYIKEAVIKEFYREGEDKVVFWKKLNR